MPPKSTARTLRTSAPIFAALGDETRLRVVSRLCEEGPLSIVKLTAGSDVTRQAVTKHLRVLEEAGLVRGLRVGRENVWELEPRRLAEAQRLLGMISSEWDATIGRLQRFVEEDRGER
jgi:DNA-binding transcriptional ArsR family regulator